MSKGPAVEVTDDLARGDTQVASSTVVVGGARLGERALLAEGAVVRSSDCALVVGAGSAVLENSVVVGTPAIPTTVGRRSTFGHRCLVVGAAVGDLCEIGNASILMPGSQVGDRVFLGEGTVVPAGMRLPSDVVAVGRPARVIRNALAADMERLRGLRGGDLSLPPPSSVRLEPTLEATPMGQLYAYRGTRPTIAPSAYLFPSAEITGDVVVGSARSSGRGEDHRRFPRPGADRRRRPDPGEHRPPPPVRQRAPPPGDGRLAGQVGAFGDDAAGDREVVEPGAEGGEEVLQPAEVGLQAGPVERKPGAK